MNRYYDRQGNPITFKEWGKLFEASLPREALARTEEDDHLVSTVWLGLNHQFGDGPPLIFETMIFCHHEPSCALDQQEQWRYSTELQAKVGHRKACRLVKRSKWPTKGER